MTAVEAAHFTLKNEKVTNGSLFKMLFDNEHKVFL